MTSSRLASLLAVSALLPLAALAQNATVSEVNGSGSQSLNGAKNALKSGDTIPEGATVEISSGSGVLMSLPNGALLTLGADTRVRLRTLAQSDTQPPVYSYEIVLLRGSVSGMDRGGIGANSSSFTIRTTAGVANVAGSTFSASFTPSSVTTGVMQLSSLNGVASLTPTNGTGPVSVPVGKTFSTASSSGQPVNLTGAQIADISRGLSGPGKVAGVSNFNNQGGGSLSVFNFARLPDFSLVVVSPNGEGSTN